MPMNIVQFIATPVWVNFLIIIPFLIFIFSRKNKLVITPEQLLNTAIFGIAFGFIEAAVVIYLRAATGLLPGFHGTLSDIQRLANFSLYNQQILIKQLPESLLTVEVIREAGTLIMLLSVGFIGARKMKERFALFLLAFAFWDIFYYVFLWMTVRWPTNLATPDILFLIPEPWISEVWFPLFISTSTILAVIFNTERSQKR